MESSSTTVNIQSPVGVVVESTAPATFTPAKHTHHNNGRYVRGCPKCIAKWPDGPPKKAKAQVVTTDKDAEIERLKAELSRSYTQQIEKPVTSSDDATRQLAEIMLRRETKQILKEEGDAERKRIAREQDLMAAKEQERQKLAREANCEATGHKKDNGRTAIAGSQVHNDGRLHPFCMRCFKTFTPRYPQGEERSTSIEA